MDDLLQRITLEVQTRGKENVDDLLSKVKQVSVDASDAVDSVDGIAESAYERVSSAYEYAATSMKAYLELVQKVGSQVNEDMSKLTRQQMQELINSITHQRQIAQSFMEESRRTFLTERRLQPEAFTVTGEVEPGESDEETFIRFQRGLQGQLAEGTQQTVSYRQKIQEEISRRAAAKAEEDEGGGDEGEGEGGPSKMGRFAKGFGKSVMSGFGLSVGWMGLDFLAGSISKAVELNTKLTEMDALLGRHHRSVLDIGSAWAYTREQSMGHLVTAGRITQEVDSGVEAIQRYGRAYGVDPSSLTPAVLAGRRTGLGTEHMLSLAGGYNRFIYPSMSETNRYGGRFEEFVQMTGVLDDFLSQKALRPMTDAAVELMTRIAAAVPSDLREEVAGMRGMQMVGMPLMSAARDMPNPFMRASMWGQYAAGHPGAHPFDFLSQAQTNPLGNIEPMLNVFRQATPDTKTAAWIMGTELGIPLEIAKMLLEKGPGALNVEDKMKLGVPLTKEESEEAARKGIGVGHETQAIIETLKLHVGDPIVRSVTGIAEILQKWLPASVKLPAGAARPDDTFTIHDAQGNAVYEIPKPGSFDRRRWELLREYQKAGPFKKHEIAAETEKMRQEEEDAKVLWEKIPGLSHTIQGPPQDDVVRALRGSVVVNQNVTNINQGQTPGTGQGTSAADPNAPGHTPGSPWPVADPMASGNGQEAHRTTEQTHMNSLTDAIMTQVQVTGALTEAINNWVINLASQVGDRVTTVGPVRK